MQMSYVYRSYAIEATRAIIDFAFQQLKLNKVTAPPLDINASSGRVMEKAGMIKEGVFSDYIVKNSVFHTVVFYGLTRTVYEKN